MWKNNKKFWVYFEHNSGMKNNVSKQSNGLLIESMHNINEFYTWSITWSITCSITCSIPLLTIFHSYHDFLNTIGWNWLLFWPNLGQFIVSKKPRNGLKLSCNFCQTDKSLLNFKTQFKNSIQQLPIIIPR